MKTCNCCKKPLDPSDYKAGKQSLFRSASCRRCANLSSEKREAIKAKARDEILNRAREACKECVR